MIPYALMLTARLVVVAFALLTWAYSISTFSPFAFDMFVRPQLFPWLGTFVTWHHLWYWAAYLLSVGTLASDLRSVRGARLGSQHARWMAWGYTLTFGAIGAYLVGSPYLSTLSTAHPSHVLAFMPLVPLVWLAAIDHAAAFRLLSSIEDHRRPTKQRALLLACVGAAVVVWFVHFVRAVSGNRAAMGIAAWTMTGLWALVLDLAIFMLLYVGLSLVTAVATSFQRSRTWEYGMTVALLGAGLCEFFRRLVFPALSFDPRDGLLISLATATTLALVWSGLRARRVAADQVTTPIGIELVAAPVFSHPAVGVVLLVAAPLATMVALRRVERMDWDFLLQKALVLIEGGAVFGVLLVLCRRLSERPWSVRDLVVPPLVAMMLLHAMPLADRLTSTRVDGQLRSEVLLDRYTALDPFFRFAADRLIGRGASNLDYYRDLLQSVKARPLPPRPGALDEVAARDSSRKPLPHIFMFVMDGLRRDYLSPFNPDVRFTPSFQEWAADSFVFRNAFTRYGGTWLAMPSIWSGREVSRHWNDGSFTRINALEKLLVANDYQFVINDHTVAPSLRRDVQRTFLDPDVKSIDTDICHLVSGLEDFISASSSTESRPIFAFLSPMNVYTLNHSQASSAPSGAFAPGFQESYAASVQRVDTCFGSFMMYLKKAGLYDNSIIVLTSDHGESLGEGGNWGHQVPGSSQRT